MQDFPGTLKILTVWLLLGTLAFLGFQVLERRQAQSRIEIRGDAIEIRRAPDGHFHWPGRVNGREVEFLVDTGATTTVLPQALADELDLPSQGQVRSRTAGGVVTGSIAQADISLEGGVEVRGLRVAVLERLHAPLLGMDVLSRLRWSQDGGVLRLEARGAP
ncbi:retropepsin-like aspartic protease family protein [Caldimonas tepidiphila]|uniref:retropepsin-like aspartic protease family protein n=1 Tax=Caldimonas tepidiphila TaxID=2315841 RepID=UPI0013005455|nr:retropepsin-like aspartic protease [Caldimonas tepidiphila]